LQSTAFHNNDLSKIAVLVTGGAGFIGSHIVEYLVRHGAGQIRILDNLSEGKRENIEPFLSRPDVEFIQADITDPVVCQNACKEIHYVSHQAALGSVPRSIANPLATNEANVTGFLNMMTAAKDSGVKRFVYASSSSVYGDSPLLPKQEHIIGRPLSPYAVSKRVNEMYADVFALAYDFQVIGLRYFNVYGPRQKPDGPYAAAIPLFVDALLNDRPPMIDGDGEQSRDFTYVASAVQANILAMLSAPESATGKVFNIAHGQQTTINALYQTLRELAGSDLSPEHRETRPGDVRHSHADISDAVEHLGYRPTARLREGLQETLNWAKTRDPPPRRRVTAE
jgi:UDP-N-acetylglucosamine 4-epimerase